MGTEESVDLVAAGGGQNTKEMQPTHSPPRLPPTSAFVFSLTMYRQNDPKKFNRKIGVSLQVFILQK